MAELLKIFPENPNQKALKKVIEVLKKGGFNFKHYSSHAKFQFSEFLILMSKR